MTKPLLTVIGQPGLHHNFLRYIIDRTSGLSPDIEQLPFMNTGTSHSMDVKYSDLFKVIQSRPVDSSDHGPFVCMDGDELMSHSDVIYGRRVGLPDFLQTSSVDEYVEAALRLINDHSLRASVRENILNTNMDELFFDRNCKKEDDLSHLLAWIYSNHKNVSKSGKKVWSVSDRGKFLDE